VLNATWICRLTYSHIPEATVTKWALELCRRIMGERSAGGSGPPGPSQPPPPEPEPKA
jgi:hypothetical protein